MLAKLLFSLLSIGSWVHGIHFSFSSRGEDIFFTSLLTINSVMIMHFSVSLVVLDCFIPSFSTMFHQYTLNFYKYMYVSSLIHCHFFWAIMTSCPLNSLGTFLSGMSVLCGSKVRQKDTTKSKVVLVNCWVAFLQLFTTIFLLLGWIWSIVWGTLFISYTGEDFLNNWLMYNFHMPYVLMKLN